MCHMQASGSHLVQHRSTSRSCFSAGPHPCTEVVVSVANDVCDEGESNSADKLATPRKLDKGRCVVKMQANLVMAAQNDKLRD